PRGPHRHHAAPQGRRVLRRPPARAGVPGGGHLHVHDVRPDPARLVPGGRLALAPRVLPDHPVLGHPPRPGSPPAPPPPPAHRATRPPPPSPPPGHRADPARRRPGPLQRVGPAGRSRGPRRRLTTGDATPNGAGRPWVPSGRLTGCTAACRE